MADAGWYALRVKVHGRLVFMRMGPQVAGSIPLVHVHGFGVSGSYLLPTARALAHRATTVVPDLPGYGQSAAWGHALGIPSLAWVLLEVLDTLGLERVVLVGNSMGGPVCLEVAHRAPERVAGIVLASPAGGMHNQPLARALSCSSPAMWGGKTCGWLLSYFATISTSAPWTRCNCSARLGHRGGASTIRRILQRHRIPPAPVRHTDTSWRQSCAHRPPACSPSSSSTSTARSRCDGATCCSRSRLATATYTSQMAADRSRDRNRNRAARASHE